MKGEEAALNLSTGKPVRPAVAIDGTSYELALAEDFKLREFLWLESKGIEIMQFLGKGHANLGDAEFENLEKLLNDIATKVLIEVPDEVMGKLHDSQRLQIVELFIATVGKTKRSRRASRSAGTKSSQGSKGSMAGRSKTG